MAARILTFCKSVEKRQWAFEHPLKQFGRLTPDILEKLTEKRVTIDRLRDMSHDEIGSYYSCILLVCVYACVVFNRSHDSPCEDGS